ncbi:apolipoprotein N-acyltransferase [Christensenella hongkongensis]|uniref:apolipoprotein N-acyltransferase n=1 Tax=Christensenella hongkongensis TaxID=270498 RepID=UPI002672C4CC|nr:apolipoprotein N-acyltransferase [Christensenella hongkongensis]
MKQLKWILICAACGVFCALCFDITAVAPFIWVALAPAFFVFLRGEKTLRQTILRTSAFSFALCLLYYVQIFSLDITSRTGASSGPILFLGWIALSFLHGAVFTAVLTIGVRVRCPDFLRAPLVSVLWAGAEWLLGAGVFGLPCIRLGLTQWQLLPVTQSSSVFGVIFIGMLIVLMNVLLAQSVLLKKKAGKTARFAGAAALVFFLNATLGMIMLSGGKNPEQPVSVAAVQFNVPFTQNEGEGRFEKAVTMALTAAQEKPQLIFLPENTVYGSLAEDEQLQERFAAVTRESGGYLFTGVYGLHGYKLRNSVFMVDPSGQIGGVYNKQHLVPFFENGFENEFTFETGSQRGLFDTAYGTVGAVICFESLFPSITAETVREGAGLLFVATNDSWFTSQIPLRRHFAASTLRAQETRRWLIQAGNNGITALVDPYGQASAGLPADEEGVLTGEIEFRSALTPYTIWGELWIVIYGGGILALIILFRKKRI